MQDGRSELRYLPQREHMNSFLVTHGGAIMTLLDVTMATAARSVDLDIGVVTIEMKTSFMQPCKGLLTGKGRLMHRTKSMAFTEGTIFDEAGNACAHATGTFKYVKRAAPSAPANTISTDGHPRGVPMPRNKQILLDNRPQGEASASNFKLVDSDTPPLKDGEVLVRHHFLSLDPYMRGRMNDAKSYAAPQPLGQVMQGGTVGEVIESRNPKYALGDKVVGYGGWQEYSVVAADQPGALRKVDTTHVPLSHYLGAVGMPGVTAWYGLNGIIKPKAGETVVVSAASGAVGSALGVLAKARGCRAVGIAGGPDKCRYVTEELGFDA